MKLKGLVAFLLVLSIIHVKATYEEIITDILDSLGFQITDSIEDLNITAADNSAINIACKNCNVTVIDPENPGASPNVVTPSPVIPLPPVAPPMPGPGTPVVMPPAPPPMTPAAPAPAPATG